MITELCTGGELFDMIQEATIFSEKEVAAIIDKVLKAMAYCHAQNLVHKDLKPENILVERVGNTNQVKIINFKTSVGFNDKDEEEQIFSSYYRSPEAYSCKDFGPKNDVWSCGIIMYILIAGFPPFKGKDDQQIMENAAT